jgi:hypothetical protein
MVKAVVRDRPIHVTVDGKNIAGRSTRCYRGNIQNSDGTFGGRPGQTAHLLPTDAFGQMVDGIRSTGKFQSLGGRIYIWNF